MGLANPNDDLLRAQCIFLMLSRGFIFAHTETGQVAADVFIVDAATSATELSMDPLTNVLKNGVSALILVLVNNNSGHRVSGQEIHESSNQLINGIHEGHLTSQNGINVLQESKRRKKEAKKKEPFKKPGMR